MSSATVSYHEETEDIRIEAVRLAHLSIEVGHLYLRDFSEGDKPLRAQFERVGPWLEAASHRLRTRLGRQARISTCFLVDDYSGSSDPGLAAPPPAEIADLVASTARTYGFQIDYLAREAGCAASADEPYLDAMDLAPLAEIVAGLIVEEPEVGGNGSRPPTSESGWLCNGARSPSKGAAMESGLWQPPKEYGEWSHSVFVDVELWRDDGAPAGGGSTRPGHRMYSCALLSTVWQLLRLGLLRNEGKPVAQPYRFTTPADMPRGWHEMPTVIQLTPDAAPFTAYRTLSILPPEFRAAEHAMTVILDHLKIDETTLEQAVLRAARESDPFDLPLPAGGRMSHVFLNDV